MLFETFEIISKEVESNIRVDTAQIRLRQLLLELRLIVEKLGVFTLNFLFAESLKVCW